jgi:heme/copper-type cytochrome/quinol oxidase subunit 2
MRILLEAHSIAFMELAMSSQQILTIVLLISPILLIQLGMTVYALIDLSRRKVIRGPRWAWVVGLIVTAFAVPTGIIVSGAYLAWGRQPGSEADDDSD